MGEYFICLKCGKLINLEIDIHRNDANNIVCNYCNSIVVIE